MDSLLFSFLFFFFLFYGTIELIPLVECRDLISGNSCADLPNSTRRESKWILVLGNANKKKGQRRKPVLTFAAGPEQSNWKSLCACPAILRWKGLRTGDLLLTVTITSSKVFIMLYTAHLYDVGARPIRSVKSPAIQLPMKQPLMTLPRTQTFPISLPPRAIERYTQWGRSGIGLQGNSRWRVLGIVQLHQNP